MDSALLATLLILTSALIHAIFNTFLKSHPDRLIFWAILDSTGAVLALPFVFFLPPPSPDLWIWIALSVGIHTAYQLLLSAAYRYGDLSLAYPVARGMGPLLVALAAPFSVGENLEPLEWIGILLLSGGIASLAFTSHNGKSAGQKTGKALFFAVLTGFTIAGYTTVDTIGVRLQENAFTFIVWLYIFQGLVMGPGVAIFRRRSFLPAVRKDWRASVAVSVLTLTGYTLALLAFRLGGLAEIAALRETSIVFAAILGAIFLKESLSRYKMTAILVIAIGAVTVKVV